jgi:uncharacterized RDD family membrane protein YckC
MIQANPYDAPQPPISLDSLPSSPEPETIVYASFWQRFLAHLVDKIIFLPFAGIVYLIGEKTRLVYLYWFIPGLIIGLLFHVYLVKRFGGTPGKLLLKSRIAMVDGSPVTTQASIIRYSVSFILTAATELAILIATLSMSDADYFSMGYMKRAAQIVSLAPSWYSTTTMLLSVWIWSEFITMLFNKKRRAVHDFMAGTIVISTKTSKS